MNRNGSRSSRKCLQSWSYAEPVSLTPCSYSLSALFAATVSGSADASRISNQKQSMQTGKVEMAGDPH